MIKKGIIIIFFVLTPVLIEYISSIATIVHFGKDGGLIFTLVIGAIVSGVFYSFFIKKIIGFIIGFSLWILIIIIHTFITLPYGITFSNNLMDHILVNIIIALTSVFQAVPQQKG